jgi:alanyl-tRNA synthetase
LALLWYPMILKGNDMTEQLYYDDVKTVEFEARVVEAVKQKKGWRLVLDKTYFYPEGGGQPADKGWINDIPVTAVQKEGDVIYHYTAEDPGQGTVRAKIDQAWRRDFMQQHTGQHIISAALWQVGKYKTLSVHMGTDITTIEIEAPDIPEEDLIRVERLANQVIQRDLAVGARRTHDRQLDQFPLRKPTERQGDIRLVEVGDFDCVACGGLHLERTREVGLIKAVGSEKIRGHVRLIWKIGDRAYEDYYQKDRIIARLRPLLDTHQEEFVPKVKTLQQELSDIKAKYSGMESRLAELMAQQILQVRRHLDPRGRLLIGQSFKAEDDHLLRKITKSLLKQEYVLVCLVNVWPDRLQWLIGCSDNVTFPFDSVKTELLSIIDGKGGGRPPLWQGTGTKPDRAPDFLNKFINLAIKH